MNHEQATGTQAAERYALGRLGAEEREAFEGHYFDCSDCFQRVRLELHYLLQGRARLSATPLRRACRNRPRKRGWYVKRHGGGSSG